MSLFFKHSNFWTLISSTFLILYSPGFSWEDVSGKDRAWPFHFAVIPFQLYPNLIHAIFICINVKVFKKPSWIHSNFISSIKQLQLILFFIFTSFRTILLFHFVRLISVWIERKLKVKVSCKYSNFYFSNGRTIRFSDRCSKSCQ